MKPVRSWRHAAASKVLRVIPATLLLLLPTAAHAQYVPVWLAAAALSPLLVLVLTIVLGLLARSWKMAAGHAALLVLWVLLFVIVAQTIENDYIVWTPIVLYGVHALVVLILIMANIVTRIRSSHAS